MSPLLSCLPAEIITNIEIISKSIIRLSVIVLCAVFVLVSMMYIGKQKNPKITFKLCSGMAFYLNLDKKIVQYYQNKEGKDEYTVSDMWPGLAYSAAYSI